VKEPFSFSVVKVIWILSTLMGWSLQTVSSSGCRQHGSPKSCRKLAGDTCGKQLYIKR